MLYKSMQKIYYWVRKNIETFLLGTKLQEWIWMNKGENTGREYWNTADHSHRKLLVEKMEKYHPFKNVLEIGCSSGPNLYLLAKKYPHVRFYGIDINSKAIEEGRRMFKREKIDNVQLSAAKADSIKSIKDKSFDIVFTDAVLIYVAPDRIREILKEISRICNKVFLMNEWDFKKDDVPEKKEYIYYNGHWIYDYNKLLSEGIAYKEIKKTKIDEQIWKDPGWIKYGFIIEVVPQK